MNKNKKIKENSEVLGISKGYLSEILNGKKGCNEELMLNIKTLYPNLDFTLLSPRYRLRKKEDKCNYMEYRELIAKYGIKNSTLQYNLQTYEDLDKFLNIIAKGD